MLCRILKTWRRPRFRFEQAPLIHVLRVGGAFFVCLLIAALFPNPHSIWMLISVLAVMGAIQYTGSIVEKVWQRALGTLVGAVILGVLSNGLVMLSVPYYAMDIIKGLVLAVALAITYIQKR